MTVQGPVKRQHPDGMSHGGGGLGGLVGGRDDEPPIPTFPHVSLETGSLKTVMAHEVQGPEPPPCEGLLRNWETEGKWEVVLLCFGKMVGRGVREGRCSFAEGLGCR